MIVVKLTILALVITAIWVFFIRAWGVSNPKRVLSNDYPNLMLFVNSSLVLADIIGILASVIYFLFIR